MNHRMKSQAELFTITSFDPASKALTGACLSYTVPQASNSVETKVTTRRRAHSYHRFSALLRLAALTAATLLLLLAPGCDSSSGPGVLTTDTGTDLSSDTTVPDVETSDTSAETPTSDLPDVELLDSCQSSCVGRDCGDDGCGGTCGACGAAKACSTSFTCEPVPCGSDLTCQPYSSVCDPLSKICVLCLVAADCPDGSFVCKDLTCTLVTFCRSSLDCAGEVCDPSRGYCVSCAEDADCGLNALCRSAECVPVTPCDSSLDCTAQVCNKTKGYCVNCQTDADCGVNAECLDDRCVSFTPCTTDLTCTPLGQLCDKTAGRCLRCLTDDECPEVYHCRDNTCALDICVPGSGSCDGNVAVKCLANGGGFASPVPCGAMQYCDTGTCKDQVCVPDAKACNGNVLETCNTNGSGLAGSQDCTSSAVCLSGACAPKICQPFELKCTGDFTWSQCNLTGTASGPVTDCGDGQYCDAGTCHPQICTPGGTYCIDDGTAATCDTRGSAPALTAPCGADKKCIGGVCLPLICTPDVSVCAGNGLATCNTDGTGYTSTLCGAAHYCNAGECLDQVCTPNTQSCDGDLLVKCNDAGSATTTILDCTIGAKVCRIGACTDPVPECGGVACPELPGYKVACNAQNHCEYANTDTTGWKKYDVWIWIPPGAFTMGSPASEAGHQTNEDPNHVVTFAKGYFVGKYEVTVLQYEACQAASPGTCTAPSVADWAGTNGLNTSSNGRSTHPQNGLTWTQAGAACNWLGGRRPSEAEWEYAATGPTHRKYPWGDTPAPTCANNAAVFNEAGGTAGHGCGAGGTIAAGSKTAGISWIGALDMSGNVWEWVDDLWHLNYTGAPTDGSAWVLPTGSYRVNRGGGFNDDASYLRGSGRYYDTPSGRNANRGARCVRDLPGTWSTLLSEDFNDGVADGWTTPNGCAGLGCPYVVNQRYYFKGDWNHTRLPAITEAGAIADAFEFKLDRSAMFAYLCIDLAYGSALFCVNHLAGAAWAIQNAVAVPSILVAPVSAPCLATPGTNVWRIERDLSSGQCQAFVDGVLLGTFDCSKTQVANYRIECTGYNGTSLASCDSYLDDVKIQARW